MKEYRLSIFVFWWRWRWWWSYCTGSGTAKGHARTFRPIILGKKLAWYYFEENSIFFALSAVKLWLKIHIKFDDALVVQTSTEWTEFISMSSGFHRHLSLDCFVVWFLTSVPMFNTGSSLYHRAVFCLFVVWTWFQSRRMCLSDIISSLRT